MLSVGTTRALFVAVFLLVTVPVVRAAQEADATAGAADPAAPNVEAVTLSEALNVERARLRALQSDLDARTGAIRDLERRLTELGLLATVTETGQRPDETSARAAPSRDVPAPPVRWYERLGLRGYTQFRFGRTLSGEGAPLEVSADRSVAETESFIIRRGRFIASGDITSHLAIYAQSELNASTSSDVSLQLRDLYSDIAIDDEKTWRLRFGMSKVPFGFVNLQSSQMRGPLERPDALNSAVEGERDMGAYVMWAPAATRQRFRQLAADRKGSGDYGVIALGVFGGQGLNRADQNGDLHVVARASYPFAIGAQVVELGVQGYSGRFVTTTQPIVLNGVAVTPARNDAGEADQRVAVSAVLYANPVGIEAEWNVGVGPRLAADLTRIEAAPLRGGYVQVHPLKAGQRGTFFPFVRWHAYDGGRKFARNAPPLKVNDLDVGFKFARWAEVELTAMFSRTFERRRTSAFPYNATRNASRLGLQVQWNY